MSEPPFAEPVPIPEEDAVDLYAALYRRFGVSTYAEIPATQYEAVMNYLRDLWKRATTGITPEQKSLF